MKMKKLYAVSLAALMLLLCASPALAQERTVSGTVTDDGGEALPGVNVLLKGTSQGTVTDVSGAFTLSGVDETSILVFSFIGYTSKEVAVGAQTTLSIALAPDVQSLEEVVVIGYGEQKKSLVTGAISSVKSEELTTVSVGSVDQAMQGRTSGVQIIPNSGQPGAGTKIRIRGVGSNGNINPLFIIDGVRTSTDGMDYLNPNDIASIEILKDAASAAIYGAEGANGVVIITTKKARKGVSEISYNGQFAQQSLRPNALQLMNQDQYILYQSETGTAASNRPTEAWKLAGQGTDWIDVGFQNAPMQNHTLNFTGGTDRSNLYVSAGYYGQEGIAGGDKAKFERYSLRVNSNHRLRDWLNVGENVSFTNRVSASLADNTEYGGAIGSILSLDPTTPAVYIDSISRHALTAINGGLPLTMDGDGNYYGVSRWVQGEFANPLAIYQNAKGGSTQNKVLGNVYVEIDPVKNLKFTTRFGVDAAFQRRHSWSPSFWYSNESKNLVSNGNDSWEEWYTTQWENFLTYDRTTGDHHYGFTLGTSALRHTYNRLNGSYIGFFKEEELWSYPDFVPDADDRIGGTTSVRTLWSTFGRVSYDFKGRYMFNATVRRDASSMLAEGHRAGVFPSASVGWIVSEEPFFEPATRIFSGLKLRGSWGQNGSLANLDVGKWKNSISTYIGGTIRYPDEQGNYQVGAAPTQAANPELTWETSEQLNLGADIRFLNDALGFTFDYFDKKTKDLLAPGNPPLFTGIKIPFINAGTVQNKGIELELSYRNQLGTTGLRYDVALNYTHIKNEVIALNQGVGAPEPGDVGTHWQDATRFTVGDPIWAFWGYKTAGIFQNQEQINAYVAENGLSGYTPEPGDPIIVNTNGDNQIGPSDFVVIGNPHPKFYYGGRVNLAYKGFDLMVFLQGQGGNDILMGFFRTDRGLANKPEFFFKDRWTGEGTTNSWFRASTSGPAYTSDLMLAKGDFAKIRQLQIGYTLPKTLTETLRMKNLRVYVSLDNYFVFTKYKGFDPEVGNSGFNAVGIDRGTYPFPRKLVGGLNLTF